MPRSHLRSIFIPLTLSVVLALSAGPALGDVNGDGKADIVWRHTPTGAVGVWLMDGVTIVDALTIRTVSTDWVIQGVRDLNGDGKADIVWRHTPTGAVGVWLMDGVTILDAVTVRTVATDWVIQ